MRKIFILPLLFCILVSGCVNNDITQPSSKSTADLLDEIEINLGVNAKGKLYPNPRDEGAPSCITGFGKALFELNNDNGESYSLIAQVMKINPSSINTCLQDTNELFQSYSELYEKNPDEYIDWNFKETSIDNYNVMESIIVKSSGTNYDFWWQYRDAIIIVHSSHPAQESDVINVIKKINLF